MNRWRPASRTISRSFSSLRGNVLNTTTHQQRRLKFPTTTTKTASPHNVMTTRFISWKGLFSPSKKNASPDSTLEQSNKIKLAPDNLFHKLSKSPLSELRDRAAIINKYGVCAVCDTHEDHDHKKAPVYECPDCGYPTHCSEEHYHEGYQAHQEICHILREQNEDDHDLRSGRPMTEFEFPSKFFLIDRK